MSAVDFLDAHMCLKTGTHRPFRKQNNKLYYVHADSNHPKSIKKNLPKMIEQRLCSLSSNKKIFDEEKAPYEEALMLSGYKNRLYYQENEELNETKRGKGGEKLRGTILPLATMWQLMLVKNSSKS